VSLPTTALYVHVEGCCGTPNSHCTFDDFVLVHYWIFGLLFVTTSSAHIHELLGGPIFLWVKQVVAATDGRWGFVVGLGLA